MPSRKWTMSSKVGEHLQIKINGKDCRPDNFGENANSQSTSQPKPKRKKTYSESQNFFLFIYL